jgi:hypothetical protein
VARRASPTCSAVALRSSALPHASRLNRSAHHKIVLQARSMHAIRPLMEYKGIEYAVRARPGPHQWVWTILPKGVAAFMSQFVGTKEGASADACRAIDRWLERQRARG